MVVPGLLSRAVLVYAQVIIRQDDPGDKSKILPRMRQEGYMEEKDGEKLWLNRFSQ